MGQRSAGTRELHVPYHPPRSEQAVHLQLPDVNGKTLSHDDPKFKGKVPVAIVTGNWCPNGHDEAQYLVQLYRKYRDQVWRSWRSISKSRSSRTI